MKVYWQTHSPPFLAGWLQTPKVALPTSLFELSLGSLLLVGVWSSAVRWVAVSTFAAFASVALAEAIGGSKSCGCFGGGVHIPPWVMAIFDSVAVFCLVRCKPVEKESAALRNLQIAIAVMLVAAGSAVAASWEMHRPAVVVAESKPLTVQADPFGAGGSLVILDPEKLVGKPFLLGSHINIGPQLMQGSWIVLLVHHDCDVCAAAVPKYQSASTKATAMKLAIIELPPFAGQSETAPWPGTFGPFGKLDTTRDWFATTPVAILLKDGIVQAADDGERAAKPDPAWFSIKVP